MARRIDIHVRAVEPSPVELCEHKGLGHPDTLTDGFCEAASRALSIAYRQQCGRVLHHNLDKGLLIAGRSEPRFGGGRIVEPMRAIVCGRATPLPDGTSVAGLVVKAARQSLAEQVGLHGDQVQVIAEVGETSGELQQLFRAGGGVARANDTSFGVAYAPYSSLEAGVLALAQAIRSPSFVAAFPAAGADFKIMGCRCHGEVTLTLAVAFIDRYVDSAAHYLQLKQAMHRELAERLALPATLRINMLDSAQPKDESDVYLTVTGLSAEMGDDGQVGRGNRVNRLITPGRPMSLEAAAGKNPVSHVGKLYNVLALLIARDIHGQMPQCEEVRVQLLSAIGDPVDQPQLVCVEIAASRALSAAARSQAARIAEHWLADIERVTEMILDRRIALF